MSPRALLLACTACLIPFLAMAAELPASTLMEPSAPIIFMRSDLKIHVKEVKPVAKTAKTKAIPGIAAQDLTFQVEIQTPAQIAREGVFVTINLAPETGILILYDTPQKAVYPLTNVTGTFDLLFVDATGAISEIYPSLEGAGAEKAVSSSSEDILAMIQLPAGSCEKQGIKPGDMAVSKLFKPTLKKLEATPQ